MEDFQKRLLEILPGLTAWVLITSPIWAALLLPSFIIYLALIVNLYTFYASFTFNYFILLSYFRIYRSNRINWIDFLKDTENPGRSYKMLSEENIEDIKITSSRISFVNKIKTKVERKIFEDRLNYTKNLRYVNSQGELLDWKKIIHIVIIPFAQEGFSVIDKTVKHLAGQSFPSKRIMIILASEAGIPTGKKVAEELVAKHKKSFFHMAISEHTLVPGETRGKHSNMACASRLVVKKIKEFYLDEKYLTITSCDCDSLFHKDYFANLTYDFVQNPNRYIDLYTAPMQFTANYHKLYFYGRILATVTSLVNLALMARKHHAIPISTYTTSYTLQKDIGFWSIDVIPEDAHTFFKALFTKGDKVRVNTIYLPTIADTPEGTNHKSSIINQYEQHKRWAWGAIDHYWMYKNLINNFSWYRLYRVLNVFRFHYMWSWYAFVLLTGTGLPLIINSSMSNTVIANNVIIVSGAILSATTFLYIATIFIFKQLITNQAHKNIIKRYFFYIVEMMITPYVGLLISLFPPLDSHTRLLLGKYLEYRVTEKQ